MSLMKKDTLSPINGTDNASVLFATSNDAQVITLTPALKIILERSWNKG